MSDEASSVDEFTDALVAISRHFGVLERDAVCCGDVTVPQCVALQRLLEAPAGVSTLASHLGKSVSATTRLIDGLEQRGWVDRRPDPEDGRRVQLKLTEAGTEMASELRASTEEIARRLLEHVPEGRRDGILESLSVLESAIAECRIDCCGSFEVTE